MNPDCTSEDIEFMDTCLINKPLSYTISKLKVDSSQFYIFDEPPGVFRGIFIFGIDSMEIRIYTEKLELMDSFGFYPIDTSKYILNEKKVVGVSWRKKNSKKERIIGKRIRYWGF